MLAKVDTYIAATQDAAQALNEALKNNTYPIPAGGPWPGKEIEPISNYRAAADNARTKLVSLKATDAANQTAADALLAEGKAVLDGAKALVNCPP